MNPVLHATLFILAVIVPGGLLIYFACMAYKNRNKKTRSVENIVGDFRRLYPLKKRTVGKRNIPRYRSSTHE